MTTVRTFALAAGLALAGISGAHAADNLAGTWTYKVGAGAPCALTFSTDASQTAGDIARAAACPGGLNAVGHWRRIGSSVRLISPSGDLVAILHPAGDGYAGKQIDGGRSIALNR